MFKVNRFEIHKKTKSTATKPTNQKLNLPITKVLPSLEMSITSDTEPASVVEPEFTSNVAHLQQPPQLPPQPPPQPQQPPQPPP